MEIFTGKVRGRELSKNKDGIANKILLQVEITSPDDIQTVEWINHDGEDSSPPDNSLVVVVAVSPGYKIAVACDDGILAESSPGEKILYSQLNGKKRTSVVLKTDGSVLIDTKDTDGSQVSKIKIDASGEISLNGSALNLNGSADFAVRFSALNIALQTMLTSLNADIVSAGGSGSTVLDISLAKAESVKLP
jgi:hypothetical protein